MSSFKPQASRHNGKSAEEWCREAERLRAELAALQRTSAADGDTICTLRGELQAATAVAEILRAELAEANRQIAALRGAMSADDDRLRVAAARVGIVAGCDAADAMADMIEALRGEWRTRMRAFDAAIDAARGEETDDEFARQLERMDAEGRPAQMSEWRDIETAPRDRPVLLWLPEFGSHTAGPWKGAWSWVHDAWVLITPFTAPDGRIVNAHNLPVRPTHWMPLPPPPAQGEAQR